MSEAAIERGQERSPHQLNLKTLERGVDINSGYKLPDVVRFLGGFNSDTSIWTKQPQETLRIVFPRGNISSSFNSSVYINVAREAGT